MSIPDRMIIMSIAVHHITCVVQHRPQYYWSIHLRTRSRLALRLCGEALGDLPKSRLPTA
jgi:hypothetical protein